MSRVRSTVGLLLAGAVVMSAGPALAGTSGSDSRCAGRTPAIVGSEGDDRLTGTAGDDVIFAGGGKDTVDGGGGCPGLRGT
jgi:Ca2+-binding RTX toxin-like protein